jgi:hypothetical protein
MDVCAIEGSVHLQQRFSCQVHVEQVVVAQVHERRQGVGMANRQGVAVPAEKALDEQVVFQQTATAAPLQFAQASFIDFFVCHARVP